MHGVTWIPFPKPIRQFERCKKWVDLCGRKHFTTTRVNKATYICSKHFVDGRPSENHPDPLPAIGTSYDVMKAAKPKRRVLKRVKPDIVNETRAHVSNADVAKTGNSEQPNVEVAAYVNLLYEDDIEEAMNESCLSSHEEETTSIEDIQQQYDHAYCTSLPDTKFSSTSCQTDITMADLSTYDEAHLKDKGSMRRRFIIADVLKDDKSCKFYTGITLTVFFLLWNCIKDKASRLAYWRGSDTNMENENERKKGPKRQLSCLEEMIMTLIRLRRGIDTVTLGAMFGVQPGTVSKIFITWITFLKLELRFLISWPSKLQIAKRLPKSFKEFPKTRCIIDCTEFFIQKPSLPSSQRITWSSYKHHNTLKSLIAISPTGSFCFISSLFTGSISDKRIVEESGFLDKIERGDDVMADRGFLIRGNLALKGATLNIPPFAFNKQLSGAAVTKTRRIARARIHVERAIGRLKCFHILQGVVPLKVKPILDQTLFVCAALCNLDKQLVKK